MSFCAVYRIMSIEQYKFVIHKKLITNTKIFVKMVFIASLASGGNHL